MVKVAICIPSYKNVKSLRRLLDSIFQQTFKNYKIVVSDDTDTDEVQRLIQEYQTDKLFYHKNIMRLGATANCNRSIYLAQQFEPEYIKVMHHDDFFSFDYSLSKFISMLETEGASIAFSGTYQIEGENRHERFIAPSDARKLQKDFRYLYIANVIGAPSATLVRNSHIYMDEKLKWLVDLEWYIRIMRENSHFIYTCEPLISIGISEGQLTNRCATDAKLQIREYTYVYRKFKRLHEKKFRKHMEKMVIQNIKTEIKSSLKCFLMIKYFVDGKLRARKVHALGEIEYVRRNPIYVGKKIRNESEIGQIIKNGINSGRPFMVARYGYTEMFVMRTFDFNMKWNYKKAINQLYLWSGFFPNKVSLGPRFLKMMKESAKDVDVLGIDLESFEDYYIQYRMKKDLEISSLFDLEPWKNPTSPWTEALEGKRVLIIHPFTDTIMVQYQKRTQIFPGTKILPDFELLTLKAVQTIAGETDNRFSDWFEALNYMYQEAAKKEFDVAIIGCGAYGLPLAAMLKQNGKQVIHLGGALQILFGIKGQRWDEVEKYDYVRKFYNEAWVYPSENERPRLLKKVEEGCYW